MLIQQLREMEAAEIIHHEVRPKVEYSPTDLGLSLNTALLPLGDRGDEHMETIAARRQ
jgi:DNA-binding HxlR family transcriptional regulator